MAFASPLGNLYLFRITVLSCALSALVLPGVSAAQSANESVFARVAAADAVAGKRVFLQCAVCHVSDPGAKSTIGPSLWKIVGRKIAAETGFDYSASLEQLEGNWDLDRLDVYMHDPKLLAPEGRMPFPGIRDAAERADLLAFLRTLSDNPPAPNPTAATEPTRSEENASDDLARWQGLPPGPGREEVFYRCKACHSLMIVKQQGLSRDAWHESLEWMVEEQGMPPIEDAATRNQILDYLSSQFGRK